MGETKRILGEKMREKRIECGIMQQKLADTAGISRSYICDMENGRYCPSLKTLTLLAAVLHMDLNFLSEMTEIQDNRLELWNRR